MSVSSILLWCKLADYSFITINFHVVVNMEQGEFCQSRPRKYFNLESFFLLLLKYICYEKYKFL